MGIQDMAALAIQPVCAVRVATVMCVPSWGSDLNPNAVPTPWHEDSPLDDEIGGAE